MRELFSAAFSAGAQRRFGAFCVCLFHPRPD